MAIQKHQKTSRRIIKVPVNDSSGTAMMATPSDKLDTKKAAGAKKATASEPSTIKKAEAAKKKKASEKRAAQKEKEKKVQFAQDQTGTGTGARNFASSKKPKGKVYMHYDEKTKGVLPVYIENNIITASASSQGEVAKQELTAKLKGKTYRPPNAGISPASSQKTVLFEYLGSDAESEDDSTSSGESNDMD